MIIQWKCLGSPDYKYMGNIVINFTQISLHDQSLMQTIT